MIKTSYGETEIHGEADEIAADLCMILRALRKINHEDIIVRALTDSRLSDEELENSVMEQRQCIESFMNFGKASNILLNMTEEERNEIQRKLK